jgi:carboxylesterase type B
MENVIVVIINYRLHVLGFMSFPRMGISGNAGLKDQQMALEWVHENISNFNGDSNNICLFGESAGATCVHFQLLNPKSRSLIKSAICQSGTSFSGWNFRGNTDKDVRQVAKLLGCESESDEDVYQTLLNAPVQKLYENSEKNPSPTEKTHRVRRWRLVIEEESDDAFISESIIELVVSQRNQIKIPVIMGTNNSDGMPKIAENLNRLKEINDDMSRLIPRTVLVNLKNVKSLVDEMRSFYFGNRDVSENTITQLMTLYTDIIYLLYQTIGNDFFAQYQPECKQFLYEFQFEGKLNIQKKLVKLEHLSGACHADDVFYIFGGKLADEVVLDEASREWKMREMMCKLWTNFAKYGDPTPDHDNPLPFKWNSVQLVAKAATATDFDYLVINDEMKMVRNLNKDRMDFWRKAYGTTDRNLLKAKF